MTPSGPPNPLTRSFGGSNEDLRAAFARYQVALGQSEATIDD